MPATPTNADTPGPDMLAADVVVDAPAASACAIPVPKAAPHTRALMRWRARGGRALDAWLGVVCGICGAPGANPCVPCRTERAARENDVWRCATCALPLATPQAACGACRRHPSAFDRAICAAAYDPPFDRLALTLKFAHRADYATTLGVLLADAIARAEPPLACEILMPVPLSRSRLAERGYNQAQLIARTVARRLALPLATGALDRVLDTPAAMQLDRAERERAMQGAFAATRRLDGRCIGLVDDVMTTGATLDAAAHALKAAGAARVVALCALRTPLD